MKSFLKDLKGFGQKPEAKGQLIGKTLKVGPYTIRPENMVGEGGFATIYKVRDSTSGTVYALKHMHLMGDKDAIADCQTEVETLKRLRDVPTVLTLRAVAYAGIKGQEQEAFLLLDMCQDNLVTYLGKRDSQLPDNQVITIFHAVCQAVAAMHHCDPPLAHRDLKAENVLLHQQGHWVLCDFGSTTTFAGVYESTNAIMAAEEIIRKYTTPAYRAPEMYDLYSRERIDTKADVWALGCLLYYLAFGKLAFVGEAKLQVLNGDVSLPPRPQRPQPMKDLIRLMLTVQPADRPNIDSVLTALGSLATNLKVDTAPPAAAAPPGGTRPAPSLPPPQAPQVPQPSQPVSNNPQDLISMPVSTSGHILPARRASSGSLKVPKSSGAYPAGSGAPSRTSSPASGRAPLSPQRPSSSSGTNVRRPSQGTAPVRPLSAADLSQTRTPPSLDRPTSPPHSSPTSSAFSNDVHELRQLVARLQSQNSQLTHISQQQQMTISQLEREVQQLKSGPGSRGSSQAQQAQPGSLVSLDSWSQAGNNSGWDAFSNQPEDSREPTSQPPAVQSSAMSPLSPQRQAAAAQAQAFIRTQASNVQSMQEMLPDFDPFGITSVPDTLAQQNNLSGNVIEDDAEESSTPLSGAAKATLRHKYGGRHRRTTSEPTPMDSWQLRSE